MTEIEWYCKALINGGHRLFFNGGDSYAQIIKGFLIINHKGCFSKIKYNQQKKQIESNCNKKTIKSLVFEYVVIEEGNSGLQKVERDLTKQSTGNLDKKVLLC